MSATGHDHCPHEDEVVLSFLDGAPVDDVAYLASHLDSCRCCRRALEESRKVDALLAAQTQTEIDEEAAAALLAVVPEARREVGDGEVVRASRPVLRAGLALAAGVLIAVAFALGGFFAPEPEPRVAAGPTEPRPPEPRRVEPDRTAVVVDAGMALRLPRGVRLAVDRPTASGVETEELRRAFAGSWVAGLTDSRLEAAAVSLLAQAGTSARVLAGAPAPLVVLPEQESAVHHGPRAPSDELVVEAARWFLGRIEEGAVRGSRILVPARTLLRARGPTRTELVRVFRENASLVRRYIASPIEARRPLEDRDVGVALLGAIGLPVRTRRLAELPYPELLAGALEACRTSDPATLHWLVDAWLGVSPRVGPAGTAAGWFEGVPGDARAMLAEIVDERIARSPRRRDRELLHGLEMQLGLRAGSVVLENP